MADSVQLEDINHRHEAIADMMLSHPDLKKGEIAKKLGYTQPWLSAVINSDAFKLYYEKRRMQYTAELHNQTVQKLYAVAMKSADLVLERLEESDPDELPDDRFLIDSGDKALHRLGYGPTAGVAPNGGTTNNIYLVDPTTLRKAQERLNSTQDESVFNQESGNEALPSSWESDPGEVFEGSAEVLPEPEDLSRGEAERNTL